MTILIDIPDRTAFVIIYMELLDRKTDLGGFGLAGRLGFCAKAFEPRRNVTAKTLTRKVFMDCMCNMVKS